MCQKSLRYDYPHVKKDRAGRQKSLNIVMRILFIVYRQYMMPLPEKRHCSMIKNCENRIEYAYRR